MKCDNCTREYNENNLYSVPNIKGCCSNKCVRALALKRASNPYNVKPTVVPLGVRRAHSHKLRNRKERKKKRSRARDGFYKTQEWLELRYRVLKTYGRKCMLCHTTDGEMHVDHIVPRSWDRSLELTFSNMQVLCKPCNFGKSNQDNGDFRKRKRV